MSNISSEKSNNPISRAYHTFNNKLQLVVEGTCVFLLFVMTIVVLQGTFYRYVLNNSLTWTDEIARYLLVWITFLGAGIAYNKGSLISVRLFYKWFSKKFADILTFCIHVIILVITLIFTYNSYIVAELSRSLTSDSLDISLFWVKIGLSVGSFIISLQAIDFILQFFQKSSDQEVGEKI